MEWDLEDHGITDSLAKFRAVGKSLDGRYAQEVKHLLLNPPTDNPFEALKTEFFARYSRSQEQEIWTLLEGQPISDRTPSQILRHFQKLAPPSVASDGIVRSLWRSHLNPVVQASLAVQSKETPVADLAKLADQIMDTTSSYTPAPQVSAVSVSALERLCE